MRITEGSVVKSSHRLVCCCATEPNVRATGRAVWNPKAATDNFAVVSRELGAEFAQPTPILL